MAASDDGVYAISVAASMVSMEIQNLRVYERRGLLTPDRTSGGSRLYSDDDVVRLERIRDLLAEALDLVGIARVLELEDEVDRLRAQQGEGSQPDAGRLVSTRTAKSVVKSLSRKPTTWVTRSRSSGSSPREPGTSGVRPRSRSSRPDIICTLNS